MAEPVDVSPSGIDALRQVRGGEYRDGVVVVRRRLPDERLRLGTTRTPHFDVLHDDDTLVIEHGYTAGSVDDDLAGALSAELFESGWLRGQDLFERVFTGVVLTCSSDPEQAWKCFYYNTISAFDRVESAGFESPGSAISRYAPVHAEVRQQVVGQSVLELGSCFGFLAIRLARSGFRVTASDISAGSMALLRRVGGTLCPELTMVVADAAHLPVEVKSFDTVLAIHLLEHLEPEAAERVIQEATRIARRRVVVAVPFENEPTEQFGHLRPLDMTDLRRWGLSAGWPWRSYEHHGGWLVLDRP